MTRTRLAILISGGGSNMQALLRAAEDPAFPAQPVLVLANRPDAGGLAAATERGILTLAIDHKAFGKDREGFERAIDAALRAEQVELVALAGFMRVLTPWFVGRWAGRMINIHPSLLPKYKGLGTHRRAIDAGEAVAGCSVHWVTSGVDEGAVIAQAEVAVRPGDTEETLAARVLCAEHDLYPRAVRLVCAALSDGKVNPPKP
jgi:phosphoribosylglycinamide formyltransferase 1